MQASVQKLHLNSGSNIFSLPDLRLTDFPYFLSSYKQIILEIDAPFC